MMFLAILALAAAQPAPLPAQSVGAPITAAVARFGPPARFFDLDGGLRAFQWPPGARAAPGQSEPDLYATPGSLHAPPGAVSPENPEKVSAQGCFDTLYAQWVLDDWFVVEHVSPPAGCR